MSIATYTELQTAVETWLHSTAYTSLVPDFIAAGEDRLNDELALTQMQEFATLTASTSTRFVALPSRYNGPISLYITVSGVRSKLSSVPAETLAEMLNTTSSSQPLHYNIGSQIEFDCTPDTAYSLTFNYYKKLDIATDTTNFLLTSNYKAYLYSALCEAFAYREDDAKVQKYELLLAQELKRIMDSDNSNRAKSRTRVDIAMNTAPRSNILIG